MKGRDDKRRGKSGKKGVKMEESPRKASTPSGLSSEWGKGSPARPRGDGGVLDDKKGYEPKRGFR